MGTLLDRDSILRALEEHGGDLRRLGVRRIALFGSFLHGNAPGLHRRADGTDRRRLDAPDWKAPGHPTMTWRSREPLRVTGEVKEWQGHPPERLQAMKDWLARLEGPGGGAGEGEG